jgi:ferredoxin
MNSRLRVDSIACTGHGLCADLVPELIQLDEWGYPIIEGDVPPGLTAHARRAVQACPTLALKLGRVPRDAGRGQHHGQQGQRRDGARASR